MRASMTTRSLTSSSSRAGCRRDPLHRVHGRGWRDALVHDKVVSRAECSSGWARAMERSRPSSKSRRRPPTASVWRMASPSDHRSPRHPSAVLRQSRLTADGQWLLCLYATTGMTEKTLRRCLKGRSGIAYPLGLGRPADRGARSGSCSGQQPLIQIGELKAKPHLEMHTAEDSRPI